ncbi:MAG TPA: hypothetical protein VNZ64_12235 [Candidatus Acidoferrum sp.]|jgi:hypothetical protein|nr:hypothetical protein [Candidatus Acidoferrum sp.]
MGLDAAVYRDDDEDEKIMSAHLGNVSMISYLHRAIREHAPASAILLSKVLYSGSHCGDSLTNNEVHQVKAELDSVTKHLSGDPMVMEFVSSLRSVVDIALLHDRPITF